MRHLIARLVIMAMAAGLSGYSFGMSDPEPGKSISTMTVAELQKAGDEFRAQKDYKQAIQYFQAAIRKDPKNPLLYNKLGLAELQMSELGAARVDFEKAVKLDSKYADAQNNLGAVEYMQKSYGNAAKRFKKAVALDETRATFHVNLGAAWFGQKKLERAVTEYTRAMELDPEVLNSNSRAGVTAQISSPEERARYSYMLAKIYAKRGNLDRCLECLKQAKEQGYPDMANVYKDSEFANLWQDARLNLVVPAPETK